MQIREYNPNDEDLCVELLGEAFAEDPGYRHAFARNFDEALRFVYRRLLRLSFEKRQRMLVAIVDGEIAGVVFGSFDGASSSTWDYVKHGLVKLPLIIGLENTQRMLRCDTATGEFRREHQPDEPHHYVSTIGVSPAAQGRGVGAALLREFPDKPGPRFLLTTNPDNLAFYRSQGYGVIAESRIDDGFNVWALSG